MPIYVGVISIFVDLYESKSENKCGTFLVNYILVQTFFKKEFLLVLFETRVTERRDRKLFDLLIRFPIGHSGCVFQMVTGVQVLELSLLLS